MKIVVDFEKERQRMVDEHLRGRDIHDTKVLEAFSKVPREEFVSDEWRDSAYLDHPQPIGNDQTISQPYIVALMTQALELKGGERVLEIGTGSGYQAAILAVIVKEVYTIERHTSLAEKAKTTLKRLGYTNVHVIKGDGTLGHKDSEPYDAILVTAAYTTVPRSLLDQLKDGGRLVMPVGPHLFQDLMLITKMGDTIREKSLGGCSFVPLIGKEGQS